MAVTENPPARIDLTTFKISWTSDLTPPVDFRVYREGRLVSSFTSATGAGELLLSIPSGDHPFIEILDDDNAIPSIAFPGRPTLQWLSVSGTSYYRVDEYVSAVWTERRIIPEDGRGVYRFQTRWLPDVTQAQFRVVPVGENGNEGTAKAFTFTVVRHPDQPSVSYTYSSGTAKVTIAQA